jgi:hypothetical protein
MANDYTNTSEHYLPVPAITDKFSYTREVQDLRTLVNKALSGLAARDANADNYLLAEGAAGTLISSAEAAPRGRVAPTTANTDATFLFQDNDGATLTDKWVAGYDGSSGGFAIHSAATVPATLSDADLSLDSAGNASFANDVGIGVDPSDTFHARAGASGATPNTSGDDFVFEVSSTGGISLLAPDGQSANLMLGDVTDSDSARLSWNSGASRIDFGTYVAGAETRLRSGAGVLAMTLLSDQRVAIGSTSGGGKLKVDQSSTTAAISVLTLDQADTDQPFMTLRGTAVNLSLTSTVVEEAAVTTATRQGFVKVEVIDDGNQITDQDYYMPIYTLA